MRGTGLKVHITITLILLLGTAMLLANLIMVILWQQSLIQSEAEKISSIIRVSADVITVNQTDKRQSDMYSYLHKLETMVGSSCVSIQFGSELPLFAGKSCKHIDKLKIDLKKTINEGKPVARTFGSTWGLLFPKPEHLLVVVPFEYRNSAAAIGVTSPLEPVYQNVREKQKIILVYLLVNILVLSVIGFFRLVKATVKPVEHLVTLTEKYDHSNNFMLFSGKERNEFGQLSAALNRMTRRIEEDRRRLRETVKSLELANVKLQETQNEMVMAEKLAAVGRLSAGLAHEIGNPIGIIQGYLELLQRKNISEEDRNEYSQRAIDELNRVNSLLRQLLDFARSSPAEKQHISIHTLLQDLVELFRARKKMGNISFHLSLRAEKDVVLADEEGLRQVFLNCLINGVDAIGEKGPDYHGKIVISTDADVTHRKPAAIKVTCRDNGTGIDPSYLDNIFDPFFTTKEPGRGTGLGLSVSHSIVEAAGGKIDARSAGEEGTEIFITLPLVSEKIRRTEIPEDT